MATFAIETFLL
jgi:hypothetical protein